MTDLEQRLNEELTQVLQHIVNGEYNEARRILQPLHTAIPQNRFLSYNLALIYFKKAFDSSEQEYGNLSKPIELLRGILRTYPKDDEAHYLLGLVHEANLTDPQHLQRARSEFNRVLEDSAPYEDAQSMIRNIGVQLRVKREMSEVLSRKNGRLTHHEINTFFMWLGMIESLEPCSSRKTFYSTIADVFYADKREARRDKDYSTTNNKYHALELAINNYIERTGIQLLG